MRHFKTLVRVKITHLDLQCKRREKVFYITHFTLCDKSCKQHTNGTNGVPPWVLSRHLYRESNVRKTQDGWPLLKLMANNAFPKLLFAKGRVSKLSSRTENKRGKRIIGHFVTLSFSPEPHSSNCTRQSPRCRRCRETERVDYREMS